jgi:hypothetical protein
MSVSAETYERIACDSSVVVTDQGADGSVADALDTAIRREDPLCPTAARLAAASARGKEVVYPTRLGQIGGALRPVLERISEEDGGKEGRERIDLWSRRHPCPHDPL